MPTRPQIAIVAALEREVHALIQSWRAVNKSHGGREFKFFETENAVLICGGIGAQAARRAAEAVITLYAPPTIYSAGFAGALDPGLKVAEILYPARVINAADGSSTSVDAGNQILVTFTAIASPQQKARLRESFAAHAVDMEAAAVAQAAEVRGIRFAAVKAISDGAEFALPAMEQFVTADGQFRTTQFAIHAILRPWLWPALIHLARNSAKASRALCEVLRQIVDKATDVPGQAGMHESTATREIVNEP